MLQELLARLPGKHALPPAHPSFELVPCEPDEEVAIAPGAGKGTRLDPIAGFVCVICYKDSKADCTERMITCKRYETVDGEGAIFAICSERRAPRRFVISRISEVSDAYTGEHLGDGTYFKRFAVDEDKHRPPMWGLTKNRRDHLLAGLNVLAFMAHCDGHWHPLEEGPIADFVCRLWIRKEWEGDPPLDELVRYANRLSPDQDAFCRSLTVISRSQTSTRLLMTAVSELVEADGVFCADEMQWCVAMMDHIKEEQQRESPALLRAIASNDDC